MRAGSLALLIGVYAVGLVRVWRRAGYGRGIRPAEALLFASGWLALAIALSPPLDAWSEKWMAAHMVQHELLMAVAAPLVVLGAPLVAFLWALPADMRRRALDAAQARPIAFLWRFVTAPPAAFVLYALALWIWHVPALFDEALGHEAVHAAQHLTFFAASALFWWGIVHGHYGRLGYGAAVIYLFATAIHSGALGALLTFSPRVWYLPYLTDHGPGLTPLEDQQLAGLLMWIPAGVTFVAGALFLLAAWLRQSDRLSRFTSKPALRPTNLV